jgi:hypothetical protein
MQHWETIPGGTRRAPRFRVQRAVAYKLSAERNWMNGYALNISRSGILFMTNNRLSPGANVSVSFALPLESGRVICNATVVRVERDRSFIAAKFSKYRFVKKQASPRLNHS